MQRVIEIHVKLNKEDKGEGGGAGLVVRASDSEARVRVSLLTRVTMLCPLARQIYSPKSAGNTQEAVAQSPHDCKIVYRDVKNQMNQTNNKITAHLLPGVLMGANHSDILFAQQGSGWLLE